MEKYPWDFICFKNVTEAFHEVFRPQTELPCVEENLIFWGKFEIFSKLWVCLMSALQDLKNNFHII